MIGDPLAIAERRLRTAALVLGLALGYVILAQHAAARARIHWRDERQARLAEIERLEGDVEAARAARARFVGEPDGPPRDLEQEQERPETEPGAGEGE